MFGSMIYSIIVSRSLRALIFYVQTQMMLDRLEAMLRKVRISTCTRPLAAYSFSIDLYFDLYTIVHAYTYFYEL